MAIAQYTLRVHFVFAIKCILSIYWCKQTLMMSNLLFVDIFIAIAYNNILRHFSRRLIQIIWPICNNTDLSCQFIFHSDHCFWCGVFWDLLWYVRFYSCFLGSVYVCSDLPKSTRVCSYLLWFAWVCLGQFKLAWICSGVLGCAWAGRPESEIRMCYDRPSSKLIF